MGSMRVHELAKEFGLSSKEMLDKLAEMKIPAKNHASTLVDAYVDKVRKQLGPEMAERAARIEREAQEAADKGLFDVTGDDMDADDEEEEDEAEEKPRRGLFGRRHAAKYDEDDEEDERPARTRGLFGRRRKVEDDEEDEDD